MRNLRDSVSNLKGVGLKKEEEFNQLGIFTVYDLLTYFPFRYENFKVENPDKIDSQEKLTVEGRVLSTPSVRFFGHKKSLISFRLQLRNQKNISVTFFNQIWLKDKIRVGKDIQLYGRFNEKYNSLTGIKIVKKEIKGISDTDEDEIEAIYSSNKNLKNSTIKFFIKEAYEAYGDLIDDFVPQNIVSKFRLKNQKAVIHDLHFPKNIHDVRLARRTAKFEEFFIFQVKLQMLKQTKRNKLGIKINDNKKDELKNFVSSLPFTLTPDQKQVVKEICLDLFKPEQMNRLLQGDVGSGKTVVAAIAMYAAISGGYQSVLMAPTEILAKQHANNLAKLFKDLPVNIGLLTGETKPKDRETLLSKIKNGEINLIIGTHALFQAGVDYHNIGLTVIDEQHRFGVKQRQAMRYKGLRANVLTMTATPIPRTLALTSYGEMDVSSIKSLPSGRKKVATTWIKNSQDDKMLKFVKKHLSQGEQAYMVAPLIEESDILNMKNTQEIHEKLREYFGPDVKIGLLHGQMSENEKADVMKKFEKNEIKVLVSTTVIEVGMDVQNACLMVVYDADHFGLSQLHQLRGRVGRNNKQSYCILIADPKTNTGKKRMQVMTETNDGFLISKKDLELRGTGDVLGNKQSGLPNFKIGDPIKDINILFIAQQEAQKIVTTKNWQIESDNLKLVSQIKITGLSKTFD